jgi:long-chain acyl-CoA synthetase
MLYDLLAQSASHFPGKPAIVDGGTAYSYDRLLALVGDWERRLQKEGFGPSETVVMQLPNSVEWVAAFFAAERMGATILPLDPSLKAPEVELYCAHAGASARLCQRAATPGLNEAGPHGGSRVPVEVMRMAARPERPAAGAHRDQPAGQRPLLLFLSSGTTGLPKLVPKTTAQVAAQLRLCQVGLPRRETDVVLCVLPFFHTLGLLRILAVTLAEGAALVIEPFSPRGTAATIERQRVSVFMGTPVMIRLLVETEFERLPDFSSLRIVASGGAALAPAVARAFEDKFGVPVESLYGSTESGPVACARPEDMVEEPGWVGRPYAGVTVEIWDSSGKPLGPGVPGEIAVRSAASASSYLDDPDASERTFQRGYVLPGDTGYLNKDGHLFLLARKRPMINVAGEKVSPAEVEACLLSHPCVAEALVVADPAGSGTEWVKALVVPAAPVTVPELREFCRLRLADFKVPRQIVLVKEIPRGPLGKPRFRAP